MLNSSGAYGAELLGVQNEQLILLCVISQVKISFIIVCVSAGVLFLRQAAENAKQKQILGSHRPWKRKHVVFVVLKCCEKQ